MSEHPHQPRFFSLKWKSAIAFTFMLTVVFSLLSWRFALHQAQQLEQERQLLQQSHRQLLLNLLKESEKNLFNILNLALNSVPSVPQDKIRDSGKQKKQPIAIETLLRRNWRQFSSEWNLNTLQLLSQNEGGGIKAVFLDDRDISDQVSPAKIPRWTSQAYNSREAFFTLECQSRCQQYALMPISSMAVATSGSVAPQSAALISQNIDHLLDTFFSLTNTTAGIIIRPSVGNSAPVKYREIPSWQAQVVTLPEMDHNLPILVQAAQKFQYRELVLQTQHLLYNEQHYLITIFPVPGANPQDYQFILLRQAPFSYLQASKIYKENIALFVFGAILLLICLVTFFWHYVNRVKQQTALLPLLGQKQFQDVRELIKARQHQKMFRDELDDMAEATTTLSFQLESLEKTVGIHTQEMERLSLFDPLTGLSNRNLFLYEVQRDVQRLDKFEGLLTVVLLDLDKFKRINDSLGHQQGDLLLGKIGERLKHATRILGLVARLGGDEFAILVRKASTPYQIETLSKKVVTLINKPLTLNQKSIVISCSIGVSIAKQDESANDLIKHAEIAMYKAKEAGGNTYRVFNSAMATEAHNLLSLENEIRNALERKEFTLYLQPKVNMDSQVEGFESLVRWDHPDRGILQPSEFIPAMENIGIVSQLDNRVLEASCRQLKTWQSLYPNITLAVNISSTNFTDKNFLVFLRQCLQKYPINPSRLELEITETLLMENMNAGLKILKHIKELGVSIAIDDFGTGYSSLSYLKNLPVDTLKIDREFIKDIPESDSDMQISSVIIFLAKQLNFKVVAEGVETSEQLVFLKANQCDLAQGFYFSKPIPAHKAMAMLESQRLSL